MTELLNTLFQLDLNTVIWVQENLQSPLWNPFWIFITTIGDAGAIWIVFSLALALHPKTRKLGLTCITALIFSLLIANIGLKNIIARPRPYTHFHANLLITEKWDYSFPSGHTSASFAVAFVLLKNKFTIKKAPIYLGALGLAILMGFSRLYLSVHFPTDILAGIATGGLCAYLASLVKFNK
tara:strand:- start:610 stop:1155 length:546 start_codon:yes stop_codon:yes gene_type:complete